MPAGKSSLVLAIDLGTSSVRTALFDGAGKRMRTSLAQREHAVRHAPDGTAELEPATLLEGLQSCLKQTLTHAGNRAVSDVGFSCFWHSLVGTDARGRALTPIYTWADARCREDAARWREEESETEYHALTGCMLRASYWPAKLRWLARTQKSLWEKAARWQSPAEWLLGQFCERGGEICAHGMATGTGLYDPAALAWEKSWLERCGLRAEQVPALTEEPLRLLPAQRHALTALAEARWWPAIGDGAAGNLGSGATHAGRAAINVGTSAAFRVMREGKTAKVPFGLFCYRVDTRRFVVGGAVSNAGNLRAWCRRELNLPKSEAALDRALAERPEPLRSLAILPFWSAERAPTWCEEITGTVVGLTQGTTALDLLQGTTEAVYHRLALIADLCLERGPKRRQPAEIIVSGGILKSGGLLQRLSNVLGRTVHPSLEPEASLRGAAVYALERGGDGAGDGGLVGPPIKPDVQAATLYRQERERQRRLEALMTSKPLT